MYALSSGTAGQSMPIFSMVAMDLHHLAEELEDVIHVGAVAVVAQRFKAGTGAG